MPIHDSSIAHEFKTDKLDISDQFYTVKNETLRNAMIGWADAVDERVRREIEAIYNNDELASAYRATRRFNDLNGNGWSKGKHVREIVRIPAGRVFQFLQDYFRPMYGDKWLSNHKVLRHELIKPFWIVSKI